MKFKFEFLKTCPLCKSDKFVSSGKVDWLENSFWYVNCLNCTLKFMNPRPTQESYNIFYKKYFWQQKLKNKGFTAKNQIWGNFKKLSKRSISKFEGFKKDRKKKEQRIIDIVNTLKKYKKINNKIKILEIGCSIPTTLKFIKKKFNAKVHAIEPSEIAVKDIKKNKIKLLGNYASDIYKIKKKMDVIIFSHSLENICDAINILKFAKKKLLKNGLIYIQCANIFLFDQMNPYHPFIFSKQNFVKMAKQMNMKSYFLSNELDKYLTVILK